MSVHQEDEAPTQVPAAAWALACAALATQLLQLVETGARSDVVNVVISMVLGGLLVGWVSHGVLTARTGRLVLAWVVLALSLVGDVLLLADSSSVLGWSLAHLAMTLTLIVCLSWFTSTDYFSWQRGARRSTGPSLAPLVAVAVVVGVLGGIVDNAASASADFVVRL